MTTNYQFSSELSGHSQDVKALVSIDKDTFASASRDTTVLVWTRQPNSKFQQTSMFNKHSHFVNALAYIKPSANYPNGILVSGGSDKLIYGFNPHQPEEIYWKLEGHKENICALAVSDTGELISGSWDKTAKIWKDGKCMFTLEGHEYAVWGVLALEGGLFVTGSADKTIKVWKDGKAIKSFIGHQDAVRCLIKLPVGIASCSNDSTIRIGDPSGTLIAELHGHTSFVYGLASLPNGDIVSCGEDRTCRIWNGTEQVQSLTQPCVSVWAVATLPDGDIIVGGSDSMVRIFTQSPQRLATPEEIAIFNQSLSGSEIPSNQVGDINKDKLEGIEGLQTPGTKEGQIKMIRVGNVVEAYQWSVSSFNWQKIGEVVDAVGSSRKQLYNGREYDFVFDVDVFEGQPPLKLPYNKSDNPYLAAQQFIEANEISQDYLDQIADFIMKNSKGVTLGVENTGGYADPFTGSSRYVPSGMETQTASNVASLLPMKEFAFVKTANLKAILNKTDQLNNELLKDASQSNLVLKPEQLLQIKNLADRLDRGSVDVAPSEWEMLHKIAFEWPESSRFPGIDILRLVALKSQTLIKLSNGTLTQKLWASLGDFKTQTTISKTLETNLMLVIRVFCNLFAQNETLGLLYAEKNNILSNCKTVPTLSRNKNLHMALATLYLKYDL
ncbi:WD40-repeat-containing domain protein [Globomyces pollinis-pini]|nr:WD40-repeat-containing domain protein [Globomyces pollinis-pini]